MSCTHATCRPGPHAAQPPQLGVLPHHAAPLPRCRPICDSAPRVGAAAAAPAEVLAVTSVPHRWTPPAPLLQGHVLMRSWGVGKVRVQQQTCCARCCWERLREGPGCLGAFDGPMWTAAHWLHAAMARPPSPPEGWWAGRGMARPGLMHRAMAKCMTEYKAGQRSKAGE